MDERVLLEGYGRIVATLYDSAAARVSSAAAMTAVVAASVSFAAEFTTAIAVNDG